MTVINSARLNALRVGFQAIFNKAFSAPPTFYEKLAMVVNSTAGEEKYGWLGMLPRMREWIGQRVVHRLKEHDYSIKNKDFELTVSVGRNDIMDDKLGVYSPMFQSLGDSAARHPDELVFALLKNGFTTPCYDGQYFFDTDHPVLDESGAEVSQSNSMGGAGAAWYLVDTTRPVKPLIFQKRQDYTFVSKDKIDDDNVFENKEFVYGVDARANAGYGLWQLITASKQALDLANFGTARANLTGRTGDHGKPLGLACSLLVCGPSNETAARQLASAEMINNTTNIYKGTFEVLVVPYLP